MPITRSAIKQARQNLKRRARRQPVMSLLKSSIKKLMDFVKAGKKDEAEKFLPSVFKAIDMAAKKNLIHSNTAARKKSRMSRLVQSLSKKK